MKKFCSPDRILPFFLLICLLAAGVFHPSISRASHAAGGEIHYKCVGPGLYEIEAWIYRDCGGIPLPQVMTLIAESPNCSNQLLTTDTSVVTEISQMCPSSIVNSTCNGGFLPGMERYVYKTLLNTGNTNCSDWTISFLINAVSGATNTVGAGNLYVHTKIYNANNSCNSSPVTHAGFQAPYFSIFKETDYSMAMVDPDGDSLSYTLVPAQHNATTNVVYLFPYTPQQPINNMTMDAYTGLIGMDPDILGSFVVAVRVDDFDQDGTLRGSVYRTMWFTVANLTNHPPYSNGNITNFTGSAQQLDSNTISFCPGDSFCFDVTFADSNLGDTLSLMTNVGIALPGATISTSGTNPVTATVCWNGNSGFTPFQQFTVTAVDNSCPILGAFSTVFKVRLNGIYAGPDQSICPGETAFLNAGGGSNYNWSLVSGDPIQVGTNFSCTNCPNPQASPALTSVYALSGVSNGSCPPSDTVMVTVHPTILVGLPDTVEICQGDSATLTAANGMGFSWSTGASSSSITTSTAGTYTVTVTNSTGCTGIDSTVVIVHPNPNILITGDPGICPGGTTTLTASGALNYSWSTGATTQSITPGTAGTYTVTATDSHGCGNSAMITTALLTPAIVIPGPDTVVICPGDTAHLTALGGQFYLWSNGSSTSTIAATSAGTYAAHGTDTNGCIGADSVEVMINPDKYVAGQLNSSAGGPLSNTTVLLIKHYIAQDSVDILQSTTTDGNGNYLFVTQEPEVYVKAIPDSATFAGDIPTYWDSSATFQTAFNIEPKCDTVWASFSTIPGTNPGGPGFISGYVWAGTGKTEWCTGDPQTLLSLILVDDAGVVVDQTDTDVDGYFVFGNLPAGNYTLWVDHPGINNQPGPVIEVGPGFNPQNLQFRLDADQLLFCTPVGLPELAQQNLLAYPNPGDGRFRLKADLPAGSRVDVQVVNALGQLVVQEQRTWPIDLIDLSEQPTGIYFLQFSSQEGSGQLKLIVE